MLRAHTNGSLGSPPPGRDRPLSVRVASWSPPVSFHRCAVPGRATLTISASSLDHLSRSPRRPRLLDRTGLTSPGHPCWPRTERCDCDWRPETTTQRQLSMSPAPPAGPCRQSLPYSLLGNAADTQTCRPILKLAVGWLSAGRQSQSHRSVSRNTGEPETWFRAGPVQQARSSRRAGQSGQDDAIVR